MKPEDIPPDEVVQIAHFVTAFQVACPNQRILLCQQVLATFPPETASMALWIVRMLGSSNTLTQVVELYALCFKTGFPSTITAPDAFIYPEEPMHG